MNYRGMLAAPTLLAVPFVGQSEAAPPPESAANQRMHAMSFDHLVARFEDPTREEWQKPTKIIAGLGPLAGKTVADIGAGTGYFSFPIAQQGAKVIAIDIDQRFLIYIEQRKLKEKVRGEVETRQTAPDSPGLKPNEADVVLIVDTWHHIEDHVGYLRKLKPGLRPGGMLVIIDFKKEQTPEGPPVELRLTPNQIESELRAAGYTVQSADEKTLPYQYIIKAQVAAVS